MKASTSPDSFRQRWLTPLNTLPASGNVWSSSSAKTLEQLAIRPRRAAIDKLGAMHVRKSTRDVLRMADDVLTERLREVGFLRVGRGIYERGTASADVQGWLGLNESVADGVRLLPFVGVRHRAVETMLGRLGASAYSGPLATVQLGYLMPEEQRGGGTSEARRPRTKGPPEIS